MDRDGGETEEGVEGTATESNVVRLPRDWLGPREELIPFGPRARQSSPASRDASSASALSESPGATEASSIAPSASDFWGEHSADMHHALQGPERDVGPPAPDDAPDVAPAEPRPQFPNPRARRPRARRSRWRRWAERPTAPPAQRTPISPDPRAGAHTPTGDTSRIRTANVRRSIAVLAALGAMVTVAVAALTGNGSGPSRPSAALRLPVNDLLRGDLSARRLPFSSQMTVRRTASHTARRTNGTRRHRALRRRPTPMSVAVSSTPSSASSGASGSSTVTTPTVSLSGSTDSSSSGSGASNGSGTSSSGGSSSGSGPVGAGAPFGPGHLG